MKKLGIIVCILCWSTPLFAQVDYENDIQPIFNASCTSCHGSNGGVDLSSYSALMGSTGNHYGDNLVVAGDPDASGLVDKIEANPENGSRMPQGGSLSQDEIDLIRTWIAEGANEVPTSAEAENPVPDDFRLLGNYPNPFNPSTNIEFSTPEAVQYTLTVFTVHGQQINEFVGTVGSGRATVTVDLANSPTGIYLYRLSVLRNGINELVGTGRMTLIK